MSIEDSNTAIIIGAGPAGLTAAYELLTKTDIIPIVFEATGDIGGISKTVNYKNNRIDIGGHRFFSKSDRVMKFWLDLMPLQNTPAKDDLILDRKLPNSSEVQLNYHGSDRKQPKDIASCHDPEKEDRVMIFRRRISRIFFLRRFFSYPVSLTVETIKNLGLWRICKIGCSYIRASFLQIKPEKSLEDFFVNRFGRQLYDTFFKDYTEKVWGVPCSKISPEWGAQRIKGLSITRAIIHAIKKLFTSDKSVGQKGTETSLIEQFIYPKFGPGQFWELIADIIKQKGGRIHLNKKVTGLNHQDDNVESLIVEDSLTGQSETICGDYVFSTMAVKDLINAAQPAPPQDVKQVANGLVYRDFITVGLLLKKLAIENQTNIKTINNIVPDNWIYIQERDVKLGRLQIFNNWSPYMVDDLNNTWIGLEYFCNEGDELWSMSDDDFKIFAIDELAKIDIINKNDVLDSCVIKMPKTYPAYFGTYEQFDTIRKYTDRLKNLFLIGRNGMHRYNNQDHSMLTAMTAVENIISSRTDKANIWAVNTEEQYHESKITALEQLINAYVGDDTDGEYEYDPDIYWSDTSRSYPYYPTVKHRKRFIFNQLKKCEIENRDLFIFDYGCGEGTILADIVSTFSLSPNQLGGCDISQKAVELAKEKTDSPNLYANPFPRLERKPDIIICSEVIEHTSEYFQILHWFRENLRPGGTLILTTQSGRIHASDKYTGHTQHFEISNLNAVIKKLGFEIQQSYLWGYPLFSMQKYLTGINFDKIKTNYLEGELSLRKKIVFTAANFAYYIHDLIKFGPQIYIIAKKQQEQGS